MPAFAVSQHVQLYLYSHWLSVSLLSSICTPGGRGVGVGSESLRVSFWGVLYGFRVLFF